MSPAARYVARMRSVSFAALAVIVQLSCGTGSAGVDDGDMDSASSGGPPVCGDGIVDPGEACDDGPGRCDLCADDCTPAIEPELLWRVSLAPLDDIKDIKDFVMIRRDRVTGAPSLVRRGTLPAAPPWS